MWKLSDGARQFRERQTLTAEAALGRRGEDLAHRYLRNKGMLILARNYRPGSGDSEVDIVARDGGTVVFVEVKTRRSSEFGTPERAIGAEKRKHITKAARAYATRAGLNENEIRFDTISVTMSDPPSILHQEDAFFE
jgi:putative endonuclease